LDLDTKQQLVLRIAALQKHVEKIANINGMRISQSANIYFPFLDSDSELSGHGEPQTTVNSGDEEPEDTPSRPLADRLLELGLEEELESE
jgi:hypothetical protein